jgi:hypothetical protein
MEFVLISEMEAAIEVVVKLSGFEGVVVTGLVYIRPE